MGGEKERRREGEKERGERREEREIAGAEGPRAGMVGAPLSITYMQTTA